MRLTDAPATGLLRIQPGLFRRTSTYPTSPYLYLPYDSSFHVPQFTVHRPPGYSFPLPQGPTQPCLHYLT
ncbi:hypothetical protein CaCOL14_002951 [Colletotrichum acutatum]